jgi:hypothetical protein
VEPSPSVPDGWSIQVLKAACLYFAIVFAAGFALGIIRTLWAVPHFGNRASELAEAPVMLVMIVLAARWMLRRFSALTQRTHWLAVGLVGLTLLLLVEITGVHWLRGLSLEQYFATRDPISGAVYDALLLFFAVLPSLAFRAH